MATEEQAKGETIEATGPGGFGVKLTSPPGERGGNMQFFMSLATIALILFLASQLSAKAEELKAGQMRAEETQQALIYMLSLKQEQREALNIAKPKIIREMQRDRGQ